MATQPEEWHNPGARSSGKRAIPLAAKVAREVGLVPTWPNLQTIRIAIESEAEYLRVSVSAIAEIIVHAGREWTPSPVFSFAPDWQKREICRMNTVDRFWFEDARWRSKFVYQEFVTQREAENRREQISC